MKAMIRTLNVLMIRLEHVLEMYRLLPNAQLALLPGTDHYPGMVNRAEWQLAMILPFLDAQ